MKIENYEIAKGVGLHFLEIEKFKTNVMSIYFRFPLCRETVTKAALLPRILKRGSEKYPTMADLSRRAKELYGASIGADIIKRGDSMLLRFTTQFVSDRFINESIIGDITELLKEYILCPIVKDGGFDETFVRQEKENAKNFILGLINDKKEYASVKSTEIMFENDPYGIFQYGYVEDLEKIDSRNLYDFYKEMIATASIDFIVSGSFEKDGIRRQLEENFDALMKERNPVEYKNKLAVFEENIEVKNVCEEMAVSQSKLSMGFNCGIRPESDDYYSMMLFSCIYGGSPFSKLFNNVREKLSLAYYVFSAFDRHKSFMKINAGIEADKFDAAYDEIMLQLEKMKKGEFSDDDIESAKKYFKTQTGSIKDSLSATEDFFLGRLLIGQNETVDEFLEKINGVTREGIVKAANSVQLDTIYFLKGVLDSEV